MPTEVLVIDEQTSLEKERIKNNILFFHHHTIGTYTCIILITKST
jgi:hypothetical protein